MNATPSFEPLSKLFRGDFDRVHRLLEMFERITREDLERMDQAYATRDWIVMGRLAHRMRSGCHQIGEIDAAVMLAAIERAASFADPTAEFARDYAMARAELERVMTRVNVYLMTKHGEAI